MEHVDVLGCEIEGVAVAHQRVVQAALDAPGCEVDRRQVNGEGVDIVAERPP
ncbi:Uncharacterised protein [Mycobacteroides abscessus subsp. abscessus]|nr:Uncharacterised protein [Mycobacteroides abscessus subsp. abscessus]